MGVNALSFALLMRMLMDDDLTKTELMEETGLHHVTIARYLKQLHKQRVVRVSTWTRDAAGRQWVPRYALNPDGRADARKPPRRNSAERTRAYRERLKQQALLHIMAGRAGNAKDTHAGG